MATRSKTITENTNLELNDVVDIELTQIQKKKFRLDRDDNRVIELDTSDITVISRLEEIYPKMLKLVEDAQLEDGQEPEDTLTTLMNINKKMKEFLNYAFDSDVADKACPHGTLFDPINGKFRFEYIMEKLLALYDENFTNEFKLMQNRVNKHTAKYTKSQKRK